MKKVLFRALMVISSGVFVLGCYPSGPEYFDDRDVVFTAYNKDYDFGNKNTYAMPDQIVTDVEIDNGDTIRTYMNQIYANQLLQTISSNMSSYGWERVDISESPDLLLAPAAISSTTYYASYWYDNWYGGWYGGWGGWYYPPYYNISSYTTGSFIMVLSDPNVDTPINKSPTAWIGAINGILGSSDISRAVNGINQAFEQSAYLQIN